MEIKVSAFDHVSRTMDIQSIVKNVKNVKTLIV